MPSVDHLRLAYNSVYLVQEAGERLLVDTGPDYRGAASILEARFRGRMPGVVVATHGHLDHAGLGAWWQGRGARVALGARDLHFATGLGTSGAADADVLEAFVAASGAPPDVAAEARAGLARRRQAAAFAIDRYPPSGRPPRWPSGLRYLPFEPDILVSEPLPLSGGLSALPLPGHTPGNLVLVHEGEGWLFSGDQLLPDITPTPAIQGCPPSACGGRFRSLPAFRASLRVLAAMQFSRCFPGHGEPFDDVAAIIAANLEAIDGRTERVFAELQLAGSGTAYEIAERIYPRAVSRRFWQILPTVQGHLDLLEEEARAVSQDGVYSATSAAPSVQPPFS